MQREVTHLITSARENLPDPAVRLVVDALHHVYHGEAELGLATLVCAALQQETPQSFWELVKAAAALLELSPMDEVYGDEVAEVHRRAQ